MTDHPIDLVYVDGDNVAKSDVRGFTKLRERLRVADADEVRNTDFSGQYGGLYVRTLQAEFDLDASDTTTADNGIDCIIDFAGNRFKRVVFSSIPSQVEITDAGDITLAADAEDIIVINKDVGAATQVTLPSASDRTKSIRIVDGKGDAATNNITIIPQSGETIFASVDYHYVMDSNGSSIILTPRADGAGWF
jgi:hypothetical protein